ncbi:MAG: metallophosphoesterase [Chloroflexi bacterium]|nr:metallophosphoesterase [Chloroflexota bacterium]
MLSDAHILVPGAVPQHGVDARVNLEAAVCRLSGIRPAPELVVHLGDQTSTPSPAAYAEFVRITRDVPMPQLFVQGNHDDRAMLADALPLPSDVEPAGAPDGYYAVVRRGVQLVVLNSNPGGGAVGARVGAEQLAWLDDTLAARNRESTVVFVHHHCHPIGIEWLDAVCLRNADELAEVLQHHSRVLGIFSGHVHQRTSATVGGIRSETAPSTWITLGPDRANLSVNAHQGFLVVDVNDDGLNITEVSI